MIETKGLYIMDATEDDIESIIDLESHKDNRDFVWIGTYEEHKAEIEDESHLVFVFRRREDYFIVGYALIRVDFKSEVFELRRIIVSHKGLGYGREAMTALLKYAFEEMNMNRFWLDVYPHNRIGIQLYENLGLKREGVLRQSYKSERGYMDQIIYSMLRSEYFKK
ncbi:Protein N-acetyltransferase, RimJ/RimL family [Natronincola peptidivorans]|uniref:Protein N-acetyltransferase, RimJ/RimL family n=1 Tax=Natronincola peptidivorans TaxID=426128 RepID=A0A1I0FRW5_9FIRM|nr:GNAT family protein [Natronincola peptidivorans]SET61124.1 Protein N-acetyltransferase, RimJ/RimL family [Natronincola peptidivorans]